MLKLLSNNRKPWVRQPSAGTAIGKRVGSPGTDISDAHILIDAHEKKYKNVPNSPSSTKIEKLQRQHDTQRIYILIAMVDIILYYL